MVMPHTAPDHNDADPKAVRAVMSVRAPHTMRSSPTTFRSVLAMPQPFLRLNPAPVIIMMIPMTFTVIPGGSPTPVKSRPAPKKKRSAPTIISAQLGPDFLAI